MSAEREKKRAMQITARRQQLSADAKREKRKEREKGGVVDHRQRSCPARERPSGKEEGKGEKEGRSVERVSRCHVASLGPEGGGRGRLPTHAQGGEGRPATAHARFAASARTGQRGGGGEGGEGGGGKGPSARDFGEESSRLLHNPFLARTRREKKGGGGGGKKGGEKGFNTLLREKRKKRVTISILFLRVQGREKRGKKPFGRPVDPDLYILNAIVAGCKEKGRGSRRSSLCTRAFGGEKRKKRQSRGVCDLRCLSIL